MKLTQVRTYGKKWQGLLGLSEWDITWRWMTKAERDLQPDWNGYCTWHCEHKIATVALDPKGEDIRHTILHEALHLRLGGWAPQPEVTDVPLEVTVNSLTNAFRKLEA